jgi:HPt (histidine-containing phosphotransfer) domain-containing protein
LLGNNYKQKIQKAITEKFSFMGVDEETINELTNVSIESINEELESIHKILLQTNIDDLGIHTHNIKGVLLNAGLLEDADKFQEIKHLFEEGKTLEDIKEITKERISIFKD